MNTPTELPVPPLPAAPDSALPAGTRLGDCEIEQVLAHGSFAVIYRAYDHSLRLHVAVKEYLPNALALRSAETQVVLRARVHAQSFEAGLQAFIGEAQTLARCEHPSLLRVDRILQHNGTAYRVMRYCPGPTLLAYRRGLADAPDEKTLRVWLDSLLGALAVLHDEGCVHAAVSPGNILLLPGDRPVLLDFEAVRAALLSERTQGLMAALEPCFVAPELRGPSSDSTVGPWTDLYALAATLHFCISGQSPAPASNTSAGSAFEPLSLVWKRLQASSPGRPDAPVLLAALQACLAPAPQDRPQSVAELRALLDAPGSGRRASDRASAPLAAAARTAAVAATLPADASASAHELTPAPAPAPAPATATATAIPIVPVPVPVPAVPPAHVTRIDPVAVPGHEPDAADTVGARIIADLDQTFALVAAQANDDALSAPAPSSAAAPAPARASPSESARTKPLSPTLAPRRPRTLWWLGAAAVVAVAAVVLWLSRPADGGEQASAAPAGVAAAVAVAAATTATTSPPVPQASALAGQAAESRDTAGVAASASTPASALASELASALATATAAGLASGPASSADATKDSTAAAAQADAKPPESPRALCGKRTGYALYQCMQTQCAKRGLAKHPQCKRLKESQSLG